MAICVMRPHQCVVPNTGKATNSNLRHGGHHAIRKRLVVKSTRPQILHRCCGDSDREVLKEYDRTHVWQKSGNGRLLPLRTTEVAALHLGSSEPVVKFKEPMKPYLKMHFQCDEHDRPVACKFETPDGNTFEETYTLDSLGRIEKIERSPANWEEHWEKMNLGFPAPHPTKAKPRFGTAADREVAG